MSPREERGLIIAALCKLNKTPECWLVPSQSKGETIYKVDADKQTCTCPDHLEAGHKCKHLFAVEFTMKREINPDGTVTDTQSMTFTKKVTYKQDWPAYNLAQSMEKDRLQELLFDLCKGLAEPERPPTRGQKPHTLKDSIFATVFKVYSTFSSRRFSSDLREAHARGFLSKPIPGVKTTAFMENPAFTPILKALVAKSAAPLKAVETKFAIDSSGFSTNKFERWYDAKYGVTKLKHVWVKCHIACGVKTNVVTAVRILDKSSGDCPQFVPLVKETARTFTIGEVSADKAYASLENFEAVADCGGTGYIVFKSNTTGGVGGLFEKMFHYFQFKQDEYMAHYHLRSNVESTFSMIKRKFGDAVRSKNDVAMVNEVLCKLVCHNLCCLIQEQCELGIETVFWKENANEMQQGPEILALTKQG
jgi:transposase